MVQAFTQDTRDDLFGVGGFRTVRSAGTEVQAGMADILFRLPLVEIRSGELKEAHNDAKIEMR